MKTTTLPVRFFCLALNLCALMFAGCKSLPSDGPFDFTEVFLDDFETLKGRAWESVSLQGGRNPQVADGLLQLSSEDERWGVARSIVKLKKKAFYHAAQAKIQVTAIEGEGAVYTDLELGYSEGEYKTERSARWRITFDEANDRWKAKPALFDKNLGTIMTGPEVIVLQGAWHTYRIELDTLRGTLAYTIDGTLHYQINRTETSLSKETVISVGNYLGGQTQVDDFRAEKLDRQAFVAVEQARASHRSPNRVEVLFSLRDVDDQPVVLSRSGIADQLTVEVLEDSAPIDTVESPVHLRATDDLDLDLVLVLDFTASMQAAGGGTGLEVMRQAAQDLILSRAPSHRVAVVEFHDNLGGDNYSTLINFTTNKWDAWVAVRDYEPFHGFSVAWDAVYHGLDLFPSTQDLGRIKTLAFLSDGFDTSSAQTPQGLIDRALERGVSIYNVGVEDVRGGDELELTSISEKTGGRYYHAEDLSQLLDHFESIDDELTGQYKAAYVTAQTGSFALTMWLQQGETRALEPVELTVDAAAISGDSREGLLTFGPATTANQTSEFFIQSQHIPRTVSKLRFQFDTSATSISQSDIQVELVAGPLDDWTLVEEAGNWYTATGPELGFGDFGALFQIEVAGVTSAFDLPFTWDNSFYQNGVLFFGGDAQDLVNGNWESLISIPQ